MEVFHVPNREAIAHPKAEHEEVAQVAVHQVVLATAAQVVLVHKVLVARDVRAA